MSGLLVIIYKYTFDNLLLFNPIIIQCNNFFYLIFQTALQLGLQPDQIRQAMRNNMQDIGRPFRRPEEFIRQILSENYSHLPEM